MATGILYKAGNIKIAPAEFALFNGEDTNLITFKINKVGAIDYVANSRSIFFNCGTREEDLAMFYSKNPIDLTRYNTAKIIISTLEITPNRGVAFGAFAPSQYNNFMDRNINSLGLFASKLTWTKNIGGPSEFLLDISNLRGEYYIGFRGSIVGNIYKILLF